MIISKAEYLKNIEENAVILVEELMKELLNDTGDVREALSERVSGTVDGHEWVIYTAYNRAVIEHSANNEAYLGVYDDESLGALVSEKGVEGLELIIAAYAMEADLNEACEEVLEGVEGEL